MIPGEPVAQGRPRAFRRGDRVALVDPGKSRSWKAYAAGVYQQAMREAGMTAPAFGDRPVRVGLYALFGCPRSKWRKREPRPAEAKVSKPDIDNLLKAVLDAGNGLLWIDDSQVWDATVKKVVGKQGEAPRVELWIEPMRDYTATATEREERDRRD